MDSSRPFNSFGHLLHSTIPQASATPAHRRLDLCRINQEAPVEHIHNSVEDCLMRFELQHHHVIRLDQDALFLISHGAGQIDSDRQLASVRCFSQNDDSRWPHHVTWCA